MSFSERMKLVPAKQIQTDSIDSVLKCRIINLVEDTFDDSQARFALDITVTFSMCKGSDENN